MYEIRFVKPDTREKVAARATTAAGLLAAIAPHYPSVSGERLADAVRIAAERRAHPMPYTHDIPDTVAWVYLAETGYSAVVEQLR